MITNIIHFWNYAPFWQPLLLSAIPILLWCVFIFKADRKFVQIVGSILLIIACSIILYTTILSRNEKTLNSVSMTLFSFVSQGHYSSKAFRGFWMNTYLFIPVGLSIVAATTQGKRLGVIFGLALSIFIETMQLLFHLGTFEIDDIIANSLGCAFGVWICDRTLKRRRR